MHRFAMGWEHGLPSTATHRREKGAVRPARRARESARIHSQAKPRAPRARPHARRRQRDETPKATNGGGNTAEPSTTGPTAMPRSGEPGGRADGQSPRIRPRPATGTTCGSGHRYPTPGPQDATAQEAVRPTPEAQGRLAPEARPRPTRQNAPRQKGRVRRALRGNRRQTRQT